MNILMFGPNGSGKGTQGALIKKAFGLAHIESLTPSPFPWSSKP